MTYKVDTMTYIALLWCDTAPYMHHPTTYNGLHSLTQR